MRYLLDIVILFLYVFGSSFGLYKMKSAQNLVSYDFVFGFVFYGLGFVLWVVLLRRLPLSLAFPIAAGGLIICTQLIGYYYLSENMSVSKFIGVVAIMFGIIQIYLSGKA